MAGHGALRLTTAQYYTPSGRSIQAKGIDPDIEVVQARVEPLENGKRRREADLRGALTNPDESKDKKDDDDKASETKAKDSDDKKAEKPQDYQLARALDLLRGIALYNVTVSN